MALLGGLIMALWYSLSYMDYACDYRVVRHSYPPGTDRAKRDEAKAGARAGQAARFAALYRNHETE